MESGVRMPLRPYLSLFLLIPDNGNVETERLEEMVYEVNNTQVAPEEVLSDRVYYFDRFENALMYADTKEKIEIVTIM